MCSPTPSALVLAVTMSLGQTPNSTSPLDAAMSSTDRSRITSLIPDDTLVAYVAKPYGWFESPVNGATTAPANTVNSIASIVAFLNASGMIPDEGQVFADIASCLPLLGRYEHALILLDVSSRVVERKVESDQIADLVKGLSLRLNRLQTAVVFRSNKDHGIIVEQLNRIVGRYTNKSVATLSTHEIAGSTFQRLTDQRLPMWASWEWGSIDSFFVIGFGEGSFASIAEVHAGKRPSLTADSWFNQALTTTRGNNALAFWYIAMERLSASVGAEAAKRMTSVTSALQADNLTHDLWAIGQDGRALRRFVVDAGFQPLAGILKNLAVFRGVGGVIIIWRVHHALDR